MSTLSIRVKIFCACTLGAFIGTLVALSMKPAFWWLGLIVGAILGWAVYDLRAIGRAAVQVWRQMADPQKRQTRARKTKEITIAVLWAGISSVLIAIDTCIFISGFILILICLASQQNIDIKMALVFIGFFPSFFGLIAFLMVLTPDYVGEKLPSNKEKGLWIGHHLNPFTLYLWYLPKSVFYYFLWHGVLRLFLCRFLLRTVLFGIPKATVFLTKFIWRVFRLVHSDIRLLCLTDAAIGVGIGFFLKSPILGGLASGIFGVLNYEIVSRRILRVAPIRQKN